MSIAVLLCFSAIYALSSPDFDRDGQVGFSDFILFISQFGTRQGDAAYDPIFDLDNSQDIGFGDFVIFTQNFGKTNFVAPTNIIQKTIDAILGGTLTLDDGFEINIPPYALSGPGKLQVEPVTLAPEEDPPDRLTDVYDIQLTEADIQSPVELSLPYDPLLLPPQATPETLFLSYWDGENWRPQPSTVIENTIRAQVSHFSIWSGVFSSSPSTILFIPIPVSLDLFPRGETGLTIILIVDPANNPLEELRVRLGFSFTDGATSTPPGKITLRDNGVVDQSLSEPLPGLMMRSADSQALDGVYGLEVVANGSIIPTRYNAIIAKATITTRRIASIGDDTEMIIPIRRLSLGHIVSGKITKGNDSISGVTVTLGGPSRITTNTDADGRYSFVELDDGVYTVTPTKSGHVFSPQSRSLVLAGEDLHDINFADLLSATGFSAGQALQLGGDGHLAVPVTSNSPLLLDQAFTVEAWIQPDDRSSRVIASYWGEGSGQWLLGTGEVAIRGENQSASIKIESSPPIDTWTHYAITFQDNLLTFYRNGRQIDQIAAGFKDLSTQTTPNAQIQIGRAQSGTDIMPFRGLVDEVRIWNSARSERDIRSDMHKSLSTALSLTQSPDRRAKQGVGLGSVGYWDFNALNPDGTIRDLSGQNQHGILTSNAKLSPSEAPIPAPGDNPILQIFPSEVVATGDTAIDIEVSNAGSGQLVWSIDEEEPWLRVSSRVGDTGGDGSFYGGSAHTLTIHTSEQGIDGGTH
jgi:hypothetical protein